MMYNIDLIVKDVVYHYLEKTLPNQISVGNLWRLALNLGQKVGLHVFRRVMLARSMIVFSCYAI